MSDARERRRQRAQQESKVHPLDFVKRYRVPLVIVILWLAIVGYQVAAQRGIVGDPGGRCPGHWHAMTEVYIDGEELTFSPDVHRQWHDDTSRGFHIHDDTGRVHMHPGTTRCIDLGEVYEFLGLDITGTGITVSSQFNYLTSSPVGGTYTNNDTHELRVYHADWDYGKNARAEFQRVRDIPDFMGKQVGNGDAVLVTFTARDTPDDAIRVQQESIGPIGANYVPQGRSIFMPVTAATIFASLGIVLWRKMVQSA